MFRSSLATHRAQAIQISTSPRTRRRAPSGTEANQNRTAIPAVAIAAPTSILTLNDEHSDAKHCGTTASKAGHAGQQRLHPARHGEPRQSRAEPDVHGTVGRPDLLRHVGRVGHDVPEGLLRLLAAARARTRTVSAFVPPQDTPRPYAERSTGTRGGGADLAQTWFSSFRSGIGYRTPAEPVAQSLLYWFVETPGVARSAVVELMQWACTSDERSGATARCMRCPGPKGV
jgi:hypothetical protein